ncbi:hypothetical protein [Methylobacterium sp. PvR107]|uniref:hypothetical protein n=1 Tax=Methylobacterium sp. PvR107 TaxID=2806597 RepID=UPI001AE6F375|nr:hypothetical protein [Methylobacterium sp. PvR107]MBP1181627.1 hypothetical protein [Methylobacterium sp. PvR107]
MARSPRQTTGFEHQWEARLTAAPMRVHHDDMVTLTVTLSHPRFGDLSPQEYGLFHDRGLRFIYSSDDPRLSRYLETHTGTQRNPAVIPRMPSLPEGEYTVRVVVVPVENIQMLRDEFEASLNAEDWPQLPDALTASTIVTMVAQQVEANVTLQRSASLATDDQALWAAIRNRTAAINFVRYQKFIDQVLGDKGDVLIGVPGQRNALSHSGFIDQSNIFGPYTYSLLKLATQAFLTLEAGVIIRDHELFDLEKEGVRFGDSGLTMETLQDRLVHYLVHPDSQTAVLPYLNRIVSAFISLEKDNDGRRQEGVPYFERMLKHRLTAPSMIELIWSYWQEQGMLMQTINAIAWRFQNRRGSENDPLRELEFDTLRPLNGVIWSFIQDEPNRLSVARRAYEYHHHYGLSLEGKAVQGIYPADSRSNFIEAFHNLLYRTELFYREDRDTTMIADAFPLLNALKEVHLLLADGMHNQYGDLTWTTRCEMLITQWMLARPEMREFLRGRYAVPYQEPWMGAVDAMKRLQGWGDTSVSHFHELAVTGERILLSIRFGDWIDIHNIEEQAKNWARNSKPEVQRYLHAYRTVTGVDLTSDTVDSRDAATRFVQPSILLQRRLSSQRVTALPRSSEAGLRPLRSPAPTATADMPSRPMARLPQRGARGE